MANAQDLEAETGSRDEEMGALTKANEIIIETTGGTAFIFAASKPFTFKFRGYEARARTCTQAKVSTSRTAGLKDGLCTFRQCVSEIR